MTKVTEIGHALKVLKAVVKEWEDKVAANTVYKTMGEWVYPTTNDALLHGLYFGAKASLDSKLPIPKESKEGFADGAMARNSATLIHLAELYGDLMNGMGLEVLPDDKG